MASNTAQNALPTAMPEYNAWLICLGIGAQCQSFSATIILPPEMLQGVVEGDGVLISTNDTATVVSFARIYRIRHSLKETTFFFDGVLPAE